MKDPYLMGWLDRLAHLEQTETRDPRNIEAIRSIARDATARMEMLEAALRECANDLEAYVKAQYPAGSFKYPSLARKYENDMEPVRRAREILGGDNE